MFWILLHAANCTVFWRNVGEREARCQKGVWFFFVVEAQFELGGSLGGDHILTRCKAEPGEIHRCTPCSDSVCCPQGFFFFFLCL